MNDKLTTWRPSALTTRPQRQVHITVIAAKLLLHNMEYKSYKAMFAFVEMQSVTFLPAFVHYWRGRQGSHASLAALCKNGREKRVHECFVATGLVITSLIVFVTM